MSDLVHWPLWPFILVLGYPALTIAILEFSSNCKKRLKSPKHCSSSMPHF
jgi:hypothetical protein